MDASPSRSWRIEGLNTNAERHGHGGKWALVMKYRTSATHTKKFAPKPFRSSDPKYDLLWDIKEQALLPENVQPFRDFVQIGFQHNGAGGSQPTELKRVRESEEATNSTAFFRNIVHRKLGLRRPLPESQPPPCPLPRGCTVLKHVVPAVCFELDLSSLVARAQAGKKITAGQHDGMRLQSVVQTRIKPDPVGAGLLAALELVGALEGRLPTLMNLLHSEEGCDQQEWHWDWEPKRCAKCKRKPLGVILALEPNTPFMVWERGHEHTIMLQPGDILLFEGDVLHAGAKYESACNTRVHVYAGCAGLAAKAEHDLVPRCRL